MAVALLATLPAHHQGEWLVCYPHRTHECTSVELY